MATGTAPSPPVAAAKVDRPHFGALDGYRALAAFGVVLVHVALLSGLLARNHLLGPYLARADVGVSIFFLLSGFLLYRPFVAARLAGRPFPPVAAYLRRRALRIIPAYWVALTVVAFVLKTPNFTSGQNIVEHYLLLHVYDTHYISHVGSGSFQVTGGPIQQSWSLATEVSFYVFLPLWAWLLARGSRSPERQIRWEVAGVAALWAGSMGLKVVALAAHVNPNHYGLYGTWLPFRLDEFALGMGMAVGSAWLSHRQVDLPAWARGAGATVACWVAAAAVFWVTCKHLGLPLAPLFTSRQAFLCQVFYGFTALFLLLPGIFGRQDRGLVRALFENPVMVWLGLISYGIYIWHESWQDKYLGWFHERALDAHFWPMLGVTVALTVATSAASWYLVERTALRFKGSRSARSAPTVHTAS